MSPTPLPSPLHRIRLYKGRRIEVSEAGGATRILVDGHRLPVSRVSGGRLYSWLLPNRSFAAPLALAQTVVDRYFSIYRPFDEPTLMLE